jgi:hypothetical protein
MKGYFCEVTSPNISNYTNSRGFSEYAIILSDQSDKVEQSLASTNTFGRHLSQILEALLGVRMEYIKDNWDGYGAKSISGDSFSSAFHVALSIPTSIPIPEVDVMPSGHVSFTWDNGKRRVFSIIFSDESEISYAGIFGSNKAYGTDSVADRLSDTIIANIKKVYS